MMVDSKRKGSNFERQLAKLLTSKLRNGEFKRIAGSGAFGTISNEPHFMGDLNGEIYGLKRKFKIESKIGYGGAKQLTIKKEWLDKISEEAKASLAYPALICRFSNSRSGVENFVVLDLDVFIELLNEITKLQEDVQFLAEELENGKS